MADANNKRDYRIFEEFAYKVIAEARACRADDIFKLEGRVYAFDSTTIELCLVPFKWALYRKNQRKGGVKVHTLYDIETSIPSLFHITEARVNDMNSMDVIPYEEHSFYIFDRGYNDFRRLYNIKSIGAYFVVRGKKNNDFKPIKWTRRFPFESGILSDAIGYMDGQLRKRCPHPNIRGNNQLLHDGHCAEKDGNRQGCLRDAADCKYLIDRHYTARGPLWKT